jgi:hypothetical protein
MREHRGSSVRRLVNDDVLEFFDATRLDVVDELPVEDGRFSIAIVIAGEGAIATPGHPLCGAGPAERLTRAPVPTSRRPRAPRR